MELFIESLTGTIFELRVSPSETILSVKSKIQHLEGIPVSQQHLIWNGQELNDNCCLRDYSIPEGATLKMVLAMRGGPINTRRIPMEDPALREMADYMEANREELLDKIPSNRPVTLLVFKEGDIVNFFRVVDRGDGTLTPLSESLSGTPSVCNLCEDDDDVESPAASSTLLASSTAVRQQTATSASGETTVKDKLDDNDKTKQKMSQLRAKMDNSSTKRHKKSPSFAMRPLSSMRPSSSQRLQRNQSSRHLPSFHKTPILPPVGQSGKKISLRPHENNTAQFTGNLSHSFQRLLESGELPPSRITLDNMQPYPPLGKPSASQQRRSSAARHSIVSHQAAATDATSTTAAENNASLLLSKESEVLKVLETPDAVVSCNTPITAAATTNSCDKPASPANATSTPLAAAAAANTTTSAGTAKCGHDSSTQTDESHINDLTHRLESSLSLRTHTPVTPITSASAANHPTIPEESTRTVSTNTVFPSNTYVPGKQQPQYASTATSNPTQHPTSSILTPRDHTAASSATRGQIILTDSMSSGRGKSGLLRQISIERLGTSKLSTTATSIGGNPLLSLANGSAGVSRSLLTSAQGMGRKATASGGNHREPVITETRMLSARLRPVLSPTSRLPPVKSKKKTTKRCFVCDKKTGLATGVMCRCGNNFCMTHRYSDAHDCPFDYKSEGRKLLEQSNPVVTAPKLPKI